MVDALEGLSVARGEVVISQGAEGTHFFVIEAGEVIVSNRESGHLATRGPGDYFGEASLRTGAPTIATVTAHTACKLVRMDRGAFQRLLGPVDSLLKMRKYNAGGQEVADDLRAGAADGLVARADGDGAPSTVKRKKVTMTLADFNLSRKVLGEGAFGKVRAAACSARRAVRCVGTRAGRSWEGGGGGV